MTLELLFEMAKSIFWQDWEVVQQKECQMRMASIFWTRWPAEKREEGGEEEHRQWQSVMRFTQRLKESLTLVFLFKFCEVFKSTIFKEHIRVTAVYIFINQRTYNVLL